MVSRYGVKIRKQESKIKTAQKKLHECPSCGKEKASRISTAIFKCASCKTIFAGGTYVPKSASLSQLKTSSQKDAATSKGAD